MPAKQVAPSLGADSYSCPHCGALAAQNWLRVFPKLFDRQNQPSVISAAQVLSIRNLKTDSAEFKRLTDTINRLQKNDVTFIYDQSLPEVTWEMLNMHLSLCHACNGFAIWISGKLEWPKSDISIEPHEDMPADAKVIF